MRNTLISLGLLLTPFITIAEPLNVTPFDPDRDSFNDLYYMQQHNTYDYSTNLTDWLDYGFGAVELDVIDRGDWEAEQYGPYVSHSTNPGHKNCSASGDTRIGHCLDDIKAWISKHQPQYPVIVLVDLKASWDPLNAWSSDEVGELDYWLRNYLGDEQYRFDDYLQNYLLPKATQTHPEWTSTPEAHVRELTKSYGWPKVRALAGKIIVVMTGGHIGSKNENFRSGWNWLRNNQGIYPSTFMCPEASTIDQIKIGGTLDGISSTESQRFICNNMEQAKNYQDLANTVADNKQMMHLWGTSPASPDSFEYNYVAIAHGVQFISREKDTPQEHDTWDGAIPLIGVRRSLPGFFQLYNSSSALCMDVKNSNYANGSPLINNSCTAGDNQQFVYTAEAQLRPKGNATYCVDIKGGTSGNDVNVHLWDCDGGSSERWSIQPQGSFINHNDNTGGDSGNGYCLDTNTGSMLTKYRLWSCNQFNAPSRFLLQPVASWSNSYQ